jgi:hypothetical protein
MHSCNLQTINAMGRSDLFLKLEIIKKSYGLIALVLALLNDIEQVNTPIKNRRNITLCIIK